MDWADNCKTRRETFMFGDWVRLMLDNWRYTLSLDFGENNQVITVDLILYHHAQASFFLNFVGHFERRHPTHKSTMGPSIALKTRQSLCLDFSISTELADGLALQLASSRALSHHPWVRTSIGYSRMSCRYMKRLQISTAVFMTSLRTIQLASILYASVWGLIQQILMFWFFVVGTR